MSKKLKQLLSLGNEDVSEILSIAMDDGIQDVPEILNIEIIPPPISTNRCIVGLFSSSKQRHFSERPSRFEISDSSVKMFYECHITGSTGNLVKSYFFYPVYNIIKLAEKLKSIPDTEL